jgi:hypothetical protein
MTAGGSARDKAEFSLVDIIPSLFSMLIYHMGYKQWALGDCGAET